MYNHFMLPLLSEIKDLYLWRELLHQMISREIKSRYKQSILGYFWVILNPLAQMLVMNFAFSLILKVPTNSHLPYSIFLYVALLPWNLFSNSLSSAAGSLVSNANLITKIYFPRTIFPIATIIAKIVDFLFACSILVVFMIWYHVPVNFNLLWVFPIFLIQQIFTLGLSFFLAATNLLYRDIQYLLSLILTLWFYTTPIIYSADLIPAKYKIFFQLNPMSVFTNAYRQTILGSGSPNYTSLTIGFMLSFATLFLGLYYFKSQEKIFADNI
jgi:ABC-type polysaccharide/polyol phosphate export permease